MIDKESYLAEPNNRPSQGAKRWSSCLLLLLIACLGSYVAFNSSIQPTLHLDEFCTYLDGYLAEEDCLGETSTAGAAIRAFTPGVHTRAEIYNAIGQFRYKMDGGLVSATDWYDFDQAPLTKWFGPDSSHLFHFNHGVLRGIDAHN